MPLEFEDETGDRSFAFYGFDAGAVLRLSGQVTSKASGAVLVISQESGSPGVAPSLGPNASAVSHPRAPGVGTEG